MTKDSNIFIPSDEHAQIATFQEFIAAGEDMEEAEDSRAFSCASLWEAHYRLEGHSMQTELNYPSLWLLKRFINTAKQNLFRYDSTWWSHKLFAVLRDFPGQRPVPEILGHCDIPAIRQTVFEQIALLDSFGYKLETKDFKRMYQRLGHFHYVSNTWDWASRSWQGGTPTTIAMRRPQRFTVFRSLLVDLGIDLQDFIRDEVALIGDGWSQDTLAALFADDYRGPALELIPCVQCQLTGDWVPPTNEPLWEQRVKRIKAGQDPRGLFSKAEACVQEEWEAYVAGYARRNVCMRCQNWNAFETATKGGSRGA
ncbi:hypothetical protein MMC17_002146 [Xylographa soralifera]|nr:hypothetical protein [Xylographa soralifera]